MNHIAWWEGGGGALLGALVGAVAASVIPVYLNWNKRNIERRGELAAIQDEMRQAKGVLDKLLQPKNPGALAERVPMVMLEGGYPKLIGEGLLGRNETSALVQYITQAEAVNRALTAAAQASAAGNGMAANFQVGQGIASARRIIQPERPGMPGQSVFEIVERAVQRLQKRWNRPLMESGARMLSQFSAIWKRLQRGAKAP